jgi:hypothetical protein
MALEATMPHSVVNVPGDYFSMAGFEVTTYGRFWVSPEEYRNDIVCTILLLDIYSEQRSSSIGLLALPERAAHDFQSQRRREN